MRNDHLILLGSRSLSPDPITCRQIRRERLRAAASSIALYAFAATLVVGALWFVCFGVVTP